MLHVVQYSTQNKISMSMSMGLSAVCDCGISWSYSLAIFDIIMNSNESVNLLIIIPVLLN